MLLLGIDLGSSSIKASVVDGETGQCLASAFHPHAEMEIIALRQGWAEQRPELWWENMKVAVSHCLTRLGSRKHDIGAIGISYQMHGLVLVDKELKVLRPSIIWCDSRAVSHGERAFNALGSDFCLSHLLNSPGNFTASKLAWVKENEPDIYSRIYKIMLPGDYIGMKMTGEVSTTFSGLSEGIFWDFDKEKVSGELMKYFGFDTDLLPEPKPSFSISGKLTPGAASELQLKEGIPVSYKAGDQPNNALSLNVLQPGEVAANAGTSGVIYGVTAKKQFDPLSRVNTFLHVNHTQEAPRLGVLLCINGTGILNAWMKKMTGGQLTYDQMNDAASGILPGSGNLFILPFGNGSERILHNLDTGAQISGLNFSIHGPGHLFRATQEGIAFSFRYGLEIMKQTGLDPQVIRAGMANMFLSGVFREALSCLTGKPLLLYNTDGSAGAAIGAGIGCGFYKTEKEAFRNLKVVSESYPESSRILLYEEAYIKWKNLLEKLIK